MRKYILTEEYVDKVTREKVYQSKVVRESNLDLKEIMQNLKDEYEKNNPKELFYEYVLVFVEEVVETKVVYLDPYLKKLREIDDKIAKMIKENDISVLMLKHLRSELYSISKYQLTSEGIELKTKLLDEIKRFIVGA